MMNRIYTGSWFTVRIAVSGDGGALTVFTFHSPFDGIASRHCFRRLFMLFRTVGMFRNRLDGRKYTFGLFRDRFASRKHTFGTFRDRFAGLQTTFGTLRRIFSACRCFKPYNFYLLTYKTLL